MASSLPAIHDVMMQHYAYTSTFELGTKFLSECVAVIVIFTNNTVMIEHRTDAELCAYGKQTEADTLFESICRNIRGMKPQNRNVRDAFIIGGCEDKNDPTKKKFERILKKICTDTSQEKEDAYDDELITRLVAQLIRAIKLINITWSVKEKSVYGKNEPFIDIAIAKYHQSDDIYLFIRQCVNLTDDNNKRKICCGVLSYNLTYENNNTTTAQFFVAHNLIKNLEAEKDRAIIKNTIIKFINNAKKFKAVPSKENHDLIHYTDQHIFNLLNSTISNDVNVKLLKPM